jgi:anti-sigma regulatory factor (Ser/Thr protein kinase)
MKKKINFCLLLVMFCSINTFAQNSNANKTLHLSKEQKLKDSIEFAKFKKENPEKFLYKRLPLTLLHGGYVVEGYTTLIQIKNNHLKDSVDHNFIPGMPDTSTITPFNDIKITDSKITVVLFPLFPIMGGKDIDSTEIIPQEPDLIINNKIGKLPVSDFNLNSRAIKITINGKILFDWKPLEGFAKQANKFSEKFIGLNLREFGYAYGYTICDTNLNLNDQILIEVKDTKNNWMIDRYNITRVAVSPDISAVIPVDKNGKILSKETISFNQKKNFSLRPDQRKINIYLDSNTSFKNSEVEYILKKKNDNDSTWQAINTLPAFHLDLQADEDYDLLLRYKFQRETINSYAIHVKPLWWQTSFFKFVAALIVLLLLLFLYFYFYRRRKRNQFLKQQEETEKWMLELKSLRSQLNPHFIFNALSSIQGLINTNEISKANQYLSEFSNLLRESLKSNDKDFTPLTNEIQIIESYVKLEQLRFGFQYNISVDSAINTSETKIPSLLIQPVIENAVKHGVAGMRDKGKIEIHFYPEKELMFIEIKDNGKGFDTSKSNDGLGLKLTRERILLLNQTNKDLLITMQIKSENAKGTNVLLSLKNHF